MRARTTLLTSSLLAGLAAGAGATPAVAAPDTPAKAKAAACTKGACARRKVRRKLAGKVLIRFTEWGSTTGTYSSLDQRLHLCGSSDYIYDSVSYVEGASTYHERHTGSWRVVKARLKRGGSGTAKLRGTPDDGSAGRTIKIAFDSRELHVDGVLWIVDQSDLC